MNQPPLITRTGRIQSWMDNPNGRLPASCTVFVVDDSMEGPNGIEESWRFVSHALRNGAGCAVHLSNLRSRGDTNEDGLVASGPVSFARIYSTLNEILRRGGAYKNGAVVCHLHYDHIDLEEFLTAPRHELAWVKRCVDVDDGWINSLKKRGIFDLLCQKVQSGDIWLNKVRYEDINPGLPGRRRLYGNVCLEVYLRSRGTCLLQHVNLGACAPEDLTRAFTVGMVQLCALHPSTNIHSSGHYLPPDQDRQVGLGVLGLANFLAQEKVTYREFADALEGMASTKSRATWLVSCLQKGIRQAAVVARQNHMRRAFCIAPTASCSYQSKDLRGFTCTPEIAPPIDRQVDRDSDTFGVQTYTYPPDVERAIDVGWEDYKRVCDGMIRLFQETGLFHGYSYNSWSDVVTYDEEFFRAWTESPQTSLYYALQVMPGTQDKTDADAALELDFDDLMPCSIDEAAVCTACGE